MKTLALVVGAALVLAAGGRADANGVFSDVLTVYDPTGAIFAQVGVTEDQEVPGLIYTIDIPGLADPQQFNNSTKLVEPVTGAVSDYFGVATDLTNFHLSFISDSEDPQGLTMHLQGNNVFTEGPGAIFSATMYLLPALQSQGYTATFVSDFEEAAPVPEPVTMAGLALGLGALASYVRLRRLAKGRADPRAA